MASLRDRFWVPEGTSAEGSEREEMVGVRLLNKGGMSRAQALAGLGFFP